MVKALVSDKASWKHYSSPEKKWPTKVVLDRNKVNMEELLMLAFLIKNYSTRATRLVSYVSLYIQRALVE